MKGKSKGKGKFSGFPRGQKGKGIVGHVVRQDTLRTIVLKVEFQLLKKRLCRQTRQKKNGFGQMKSGMKANGL